MEIKKLIQKPLNNSALVVLFEHKLSYFKSKHQKKPNHVIHITSFTLPRSVIGALY